MKHLILLILVLSCNYGISQVPCTLIEFDKHADKDYYVQRVEDLINKDFQKIHKNSGREEFVVPQIKLTTENSIPFLTIEFVNMEQYKKGDDIYSHIIIDSCITYTFALTDKSNNVIGFTSFDGSISGDYTQYGKNSKWVNNFFKAINRENPDLMLYCRSMSFYFGIDGFMFLKNNHIYVAKDRSCFIELNEFINSLNINDILLLKNTIIPNIYQPYNINDNSRKSGQTPNNEKMLF